MTVGARIHRLHSELPDNIKLLAVSKFHSVETIREAYNAGQRRFGENRVQELAGKVICLPQDVEWHFIGHLQANKVKYLVPFVHTIQSVDSRNLLSEINHQAEKVGRQIRVLLQIHIAQEAHKFGFSFEEAETLCQEQLQMLYPYVRIAGLMGMASLTDDREQIRREFATLHRFFLQLQERRFSATDFNELSMGMSDDYQIAIEEGSTLIRIGSKIFGART
ncbi:MAG: YggS family pyridoxal phosphate-dependent enzyme [Candidatus Symbiothrix sp.]|jgi:pyridoxal phosphate enzyme (YggS family)|nr:YggS family pyridoxal phosphate-dependent enzyme [Candidatus Symbiothrix sp.]